MSRTILKLETQQRRAKVAALITSRATYRQMADTLGVSLGTIAGDVKLLVKQWAREQSPEDRQKWLTIEVEKLGQMEFALANDCRHGNQGAIDRALRIMERRARLLGLDAPTKIAPTTPDGMNPYEGVSDAELRAVIAGLARAIGASDRGGDLSLDLAGTPEPDRAAG